jgi:hypothetical protein
MTKWAGWWLGMLLAFAMVAPAWSQAYRPYQDPWGPTPPSSSDRLVYPRYVDPWGPITYGTDRIIYPQYGSPARPKTSGPGGPILPPPGSQSANRLASP